MAMTAAITVMATRMVISSVNVSVLGCVHSCLKKVFSFVYPQIHRSLLKECPEQADQHEHEQHGEGEETVARHTPLVTQRP